MKESTIDRTLGREAFGADPSGYHAARPPYPDWVFEILCERCDLAHGASYIRDWGGYGDGDSSIT